MTQSPMQSVPGPASMLSRLLGWIGKPQQEAEASVNLEVDPLDVEISRTVSAKPAGFSSRTLIDELMAHSAPLFRDGASLLLGSRARPDQPHSPYLAKSMAAALEERDAELAAVAQGSKPGRSLEVKSLHPEDYQSIAEYADFLFSRDRSGRASSFSGLIQPRSPSAASSSAAPPIRVNELFFRDALQANAILMPQLLHVLNVAYVRTAALFAGIARANVAITEKSGAAALSDEVEINQVLDGGIFQSSSPTVGLIIPADGFASLSLDFTSATGEVIKQVPLNGMNLFNMSRRSTELLTGQWESVFSGQVVAVCQDLCKEIAEVVRGHNAQLGQAISDNTVMLGSQIATILDPIAANRRLRASGKAFIPLSKLNQSMKDFNATLDREAISLALRFGTMKTFTYATYVAFRSSELKARLSASPYKGAWLLLSLPDELFARINGLPVSTAGKVLDTLRHMHDALEPDMRERIGQESAQYLMGFRRRSGARVSNGTGKPMMNSFESLPDLMEGGLAKPDEAGKVLAGAFNHLAKSYGGAEHIKRLPPSHRLMTSLPLMQLLANSKRTEVAFIQEPLNLPIERRAEVAGIVLRDAIEEARKKTPVTQEPHPDEFNPDLDDFIKSPSYQAIATLRGSYDQVQVGERAIASALKSMLGIKPGAAPLVSEIEPGESGARAREQWSLAFIKKVDAFDGESQLTEVNIEPSGESSDLLRIGQPYQLSFVSGGKKPLWVHMTVVLGSVAPGVSPHSVIPRQRPFLGSAGSGLVFFDAQSGQRSLQVIAAAPRQDARNYGDDFSDGHDHTFCPVVPSRTLKSFAETGRMDDAIYRGVPGKAEMLMVQRKRKLGVKALIGMQAHASALANAVRDRLAEGLQRDPLLGAAVLGKQQLELVGHALLDSKTARGVPAAVAMRAGLVAAATGNAALLGAAARHSRDPFKLTQAGASLLDVAEWFEAAKRIEDVDLTGWVGLPADAFTKSDEDRLIPQAVDGLTQNKRFQDDPAMAAALLERSAANCLRKDPALLDRFLEAGLEMKPSLTGLLDEIHPSQVSDETRRQWLATSMERRIQEASMASRAAEPPSNNPMDKEASNEPVVATSTPRRRAGL